MRNILITKEIYCLAKNYILAIFSRLFYLILPQE